ncbi:low molecular weight protein-tyrosine-phosphatase [Thiorhodospira sibirica]|uniref:low molecular weight protein-tyrosine-phosphatase n=1 Tax=Thiorhodospira sibirica TaxID=154347 RepID=UPI00022C2849|nr:low molecular weight protein-tyrosine-phosphatase [Thiorhodospira sibirica]
MSQTNESQAKIRVLFVCMGNICRSPMAQGVFEHLVAEAGLAERFEIDSAGTHAYHIGEPPDQRAMATAKQRGIDLSSQRARQVEAEDGREFDYILVMDQDNLAGVRAVLPPSTRNKPRLFLEFARSHEYREVPDPYYGGQRGFDQVLDMITDAATGLLAEIRTTHPL